MRYLVVLAVVTSVPRIAPDQVEQTLQVGAVLASLPAGAQVVPFPHGPSRLGGTRVRLEERLTLELAALPNSATPLKVFVDSIVASRNARLPSAWRLRPAEPRVVHGRTAWVLHPRCGDCEAIEVYLDFPGSRLVAAWGVDGLEAVTVPERHARAWQFLATLRPVHAAG